MRKNFKLVLCILIISFFQQFFCSETIASDKDSYIKVVDFRGRTLIFKNPVKRIVCLIESALSGLYMLGAEKEIIGVSTNVYQRNVYSYYSALDNRIKNKTLPTPGNWDFVNIESVVALKPDIVIIWSKQTESINALEERGIKVFGVFITKKEDVYKEIMEFGKLTGKVSRAKEIIEYTKSETEKFCSRVAKIPFHKRQRVYYMWAQSKLDTSCGGSMVQDLISLAGCRNVCDSITSEHITVNFEKIISWNPDLIVMWYNEKIEPFDIINDPQWRILKAVKDKRVYEFPEIFLCDLWTLKYVYAVKMVAKWAYPELFKDIDLEKEKISMLKKLYKKYPSDK